MALRFQDPALEQSYSRFEALERIPQIRAVGILIGLLSLFLAFAIADFQAGMSPNQMRVVGFLLAGFYFVMSAINVESNLIFLQRFGQTITFVGTLLPLFVIVYVSHATPSSDIAVALKTAGANIEPDDARTIVSGLYTLLITFATATATRLRFAYIVVYCLTATFSMMLLMWRYPPNLAFGVTYAAIQFATTAISLLVAYQLEWYNRQNFHQAWLLEAAHKQSEELLLNILPAPIAARLKADKRSIADGFAEVTVAFADVAGFTHLAAKMPPADLVELLNRVFSEFDRIAERLGLEKIKTIGDAYMVAGGLPEFRSDHAEAVADMALAMQAAIENFRGPNGENLQMRIGINTGPVVAGVIGVKKFIYDLWGDTVNTASRMESHGCNGMIQVSESTYDKLQGKYKLSARGPVQIKGKGEMPVWFLQGKL